MAIELSWTISGGIHDPNAQSADRYRRGISDRRSGDTQSPLHPHAYGRSRATGAARARDRGCVERRTHCSHDRAGGAVVPDRGRSARRAGSSAPRGVCIGSRHGHAGGGVRNPPVCLLAASRRAAARPVRGPGRRSARGGAAHADLRHARAHRGRRPGLCRRLCERGALHVAAPAYAVHELAVLDRPRHGLDVVSVDFARQPAAQRHPA